MLEDPDDQSARESLKSLLRDRIVRDAEFSDWLQDLWSQVAPEIQMDASRSVNIISGTVHGNAVQARDVEGGIHIGREDHTARSRDQQAPAPEAK